MTRRQWMIAFGVAGTVALVAPALAAAQGRFHGLDANRDGVITRAEWRGNDTSFRQHDRNRDGVISGAEIRRVPAVSDRKAPKAKAKAAKPVKAKPAKPPTSGRGRGRGHG